MAAVHARIILVRIDGEIFSTLIVNKVSGIADSLIQLLMCATAKSWLKFDPSPSFCMNAPMRSEAYTKSFVRLYVNFPRQTFEI